MDAELNTGPRIRDLLSPHPEDAVRAAIATPEAWFAKRKRLQARVLQTIGQPPPIEPPAPRFRVFHDVQEPEYRHLKIAYDVEPGEEVRAHLLIPPPERRKRGAAVLCLHGTAPEAKETQIGLGARPGRDYGRFLARHGFITLSPDHVCAGERQAPGYRPYDTASFYARHPEWSAVGKAIWDGQRAVDVLCRVPEADPGRIGAAGHSLGGHGSMFVAAFDERVAATVSSCGLTTWAGNPKRLNWARDEWYSYIPQLRPVFLAGGEPPFDLHEFAALIAPRAFLNISGMSDPTYGNNETLPEVGHQLHKVYELLGATDRFANFLFGGGHDVPGFSRALTVAWLEEWLVSGG